MLDWPQRFSLSGWRSGHDPPLRKGLGPPARKRSPRCADAFALLQDSDRADPRLAAVHNNETHVSATRDDISW